MTKPTTHVERARQGRHKPTRSQLAIEHVRKLQEEKRQKLERGESLMRERAAGPDVFGRYSWQREPGELPGLPPPLDPFGPKS
jgi:hypothetical protein